MCYAQEVVLSCPIINFLKGQIVRRFHTVCLPLRTRKQGFVSVASQHECSFNYLPRYSLFKITAYRWNILNSTNAKMTNAASANQPGGPRSISTSLKFTIASNIFRSVKNKNARYFPGLVNVFTNQRVLVCLPSDRLPATGYRQHVCLPVSPLVGVLALSCLGETFKI